VDVTVKVGVLVEVGVGTNTVCKIVLVVKSTVSFESISALLLILAPFGAVARTSMVNPQVPGTPTFALPKFHVIVLPAKFPKGTVVQLIVEVSRLAFNTSVIVTPVAVALPSFI